MKVVVLQSNYIPWKGYFELIDKCQLFCFYDEVQYTKNDWRNRNVIYSKNGKFWLTIPIAKSAVHKLISDVAFIDLKWRRKHLTSIKQAYSNAPFFNEFFPLLEELYSYDTKYLSEFNQNIIKQISSYIGIDTKFDNSAKYKLADGKVNRLLSLLEQLGATSYISGAAGRSYLESEIDTFKKAEIELLFHDYKEFPKYKQRGDQFFNDVSIIDVCMHIEQSELLDYIRSK